VQKIISDLLEEETFIGSTQVVIDAVKNRADLDVTVAYVREQLHEQGLKYKKVKHISWQGNSEKSLVLRQKWAQAFLNIDLKAKNVINIDVTWLGMTDFRRQHWKPYKSNCSVKM
jgi:hypothetical protein